MIPGVEGKTVAVVGRAASLNDSRNGAAIDGCDVVVRVNWTLPIQGDPESVGTRTDILYHCTGCLAQKAAAEALGVTTVNVAKGLRKALAKQSKAGVKKYRPNTGVVAVIDALNCGAAAVRAFGFDFYASGVVYAHAPPTWPIGKKRPSRKIRHIQKHDKQLLRAIGVADPRFQPDTLMARALRAP